MRAMAGARVSSSERLSQVEGDRGNHSSWNKKTRARPSRQPPGPEQGTRIQRKTLPEAKSPPAKCALFELAGQLAKGRLQQQHRPGKAKARHRADRAPAGLLARPNWRASSALRQEQQHRGVRRGTKHGPLHSAAAARPPAPLQGGRRRDGQQQGPQQRSFATPTRVLLSR